MRKFLMIILENFLKNVKMAEKPKFFFSNLQFVENLHVG